MDPNFWHRFSVAVHQDDAAKEAAKGLELKHSYVSSSRASSLSPINTPTSPSPPSPAFHTIPWPNPPLPVALQPSSPTMPYAPAAPISLNRNPSRLIKTQAPSISPKKTRRPFSTHNSFTRHKTTSQLTLGLSGRPESRFKFWAQVTADPSSRDSWLESQQKKRRQRTWICWAFWLGFTIFVAAIVVCILVLKAQKII